MLIVVCNAFYIILGQASGAGFYYSCAYPQMSTLWASILKPQAAVCYIYVPSKAASIFFILAVHHLVQTFTLCRLFYASSCSCMASSRIYSHINLYLSLGHDLMKWHHANLRHLLENKNDVKLGGADAKCSYEGDICRQSVPDLSLTLDLFQWARNLCANSSHQC